MDEIKYFLVLERRLGDYNIIDINKLDICNGLVTNDLTSIDSFTCNFSELEIREAILRCNISHSNYINGTLKVISDMKHNFKVITKDILGTIREFQTNDMAIDREFKNKLFGIYKKLIESIFTDKDFIQGMLDRFKLALKNENKIEIFTILEELPYNKSRIIYLSIYEEIEKRKQENLRKLEKLDDVA